MDNRNASNLVWKDLCVNSKNIRENLSSKIEEYVRKFNFWKRIISFCLIAIVCLILFWVENHYRISYLKDFNGRLSHKYNLLFFYLSRTLYKEPLRLNLHPMFFLTTGNTDSE